jgi:hypothetical protein
MGASKKHIMKCSEESALAVNFVGPVVAGRPELLRCNYVPLWVKFDRSLLPTTTPADPQQADDFTRT